MARDYYVVLGVPREASPEQIKDAFRRSAKRLHPDTCADSDGRGFCELDEAYRTLSDRDRRRAYDATLRPELSHRVGRRKTPVYCRTTIAPGAPPVVPLDDPPLPQGFHTIDVRLQIPEALARYGGAVTVELPLAAPCPACGGTFFARRVCPWCRGRGTIDTSVTLPLTIDAGTRDGDCLTLVLNRLRRVVNTFFFLED